MITGMPASARGRQRVRNEAAGGEGPQQAVEPLRLVVAGGEDVDAGGRAWNALCASLQTVMSRRRA